MAKLLPQQVQAEDYDLQVAAETEWKELLNNNTALPVMKGIQKAWDTPLYESKYQELLNQQSDSLERARLLAVASENASDWLHAIPIANLGLKMNNATKPRNTRPRLPRATWGRAHEPQQPPQHIQTDSANFAHEC